ncbi:MAG: hypothetical protein CL607_28035 [Anaerolineaceae bacterium]|nr:hypothetical protein [Anaerolineaceae bacterium]
MKIVFSISKQFLADHALQLPLRLMKTTLGIRNDEASKSFTAEAASVVRDDFEPYTIAQADLMIAIYDGHFDAPMPGQSMSQVEREYQYALEQGLSILVFVHETAKHTSDERQQRFLRQVAERFVINYFSSLADLTAKIDVELANKATMLRDQRRTTVQAQVTPNTTTQEVGAVEGVPAEEEAAEEEAADEDEFTSGSEPEEPEEPSRSRGGWFRREERAEPAPSVAPPPPPAPAKPSAPIPQPAPGSIDGQTEEMPAVGGEVGGVIDASAQAVDPLQNTVERAFAMVSDDIQLIVQRALDLHEAQQLVLQERVPDGWLKADPVFDRPLVRSQFQMDLFMVMPFEEPYNSIYENIIVPTAHDLNLTIKRGDEFASQRGSIMSEVWAALNGCRLVLAETTLVNPNVYYELGIAHTLGKPTILLTQQPDFEAVPFDIRHLRFIAYENSIEGGEQLREQLRKSILWILNDLKDAENGNGE